MISSPEAAKSVLVTRAHLFKPTYPPSKERMIGPEAIFFHQGPYHSRLKKLVQSSFLPCAIKGSVSEIEHIVLKLLPTWNNSTTINTLQEMKRVYLFNCFVHINFSHSFFFSQNFLHDSLWWSESQPHEESKSFFLLNFWDFCVSMLLMWQWYRPSGKNWTQK